MSAWLADSAGVHDLLPARANPGRKIRPWSVDEARRFLESARSESDRLCAAYVLLLVLGLRKGELLGLTWEMVSLDGAELSSFQLG